MTGLVVDQWENMDSFAVYVVMEELQWWVVMQLIFLLPLAYARRRFNVLHSLDQVGREMEKKEYTHSARNQIKGCAWIRLNLCTG
jgi:hypothetical protein